MIKNDREKFFRNHQIISFHNFLNYKNNDNLIELYNYIIYEIDENE